MWKHELNVQISRRFRRLPTGLLHILQLVGMFDSLHGGVRKNDLIASSHFFVPLTLASLNLLTSLCCDNSSHSISPSINLSMSSAMSVCSFFFCFLFVCLLQAFLDFIYVVIYVLDRCCRFSGCDNNLLAFSCLLTAEILFEQWTIMSVFLPEDSQMNTPSTVVSHQEDKC